jgi:mRNA interferase MazF
VQHPIRGDVHFVSFDQHRGSEQAGHRPALVVSNDGSNERSTLVTVVAVTHTIPTRRYLHNVDIPHDVLDGRGGTILCNQLLTISKERLGRFISHLPDHLMSKVDSALRHHLDL